MEEMIPGAEKTAGLEEELVAEQKTRETAMAVTRGKMEVVLTAKTGKEKETTAREAEILVALAAEVVREEVEALMVEAARDKAAALAVPRAVLCLEILKLFQVSTAWRQRLS